MADNFAFRREKLYQGYTVANFFETLEFLVNHGVLHRDSKNGRLKYHLMVYWQAEQKIKFGLLKLLRRQLPKKFHKFTRCITTFNEHAGFWGKIPNGPINKFSAIFCENLRQFTT